MESVSRPIGVLGRFCPMHASIKAKRVTGSSPELLQLIPVYTCMPNDVPCVQKELVCMHADID